MAKPLKELSLRELLETSHGTKNHTFYSGIGIPAMNARTELERRLLAIDTVTRDHARIFAEQTNGGSVIALNLIRHILDGEPDA